MTAAATLLGANGATVLEQLAREQKRQTRNAPNKQAVTVGALDDVVHVALIAGDLGGYLPAPTPPP
jgi:hypothetical protein